MVWLRAHWQALLVGIFVFLVGIGIGAAGGGSSKTKTVTPKALTVTNVSTKISTVTRTIKHRPKPPPPPVAKPPPPPPAAALQFSGNGGKDLAPIHVAHDSTLFWTNDGDLFSLNDPDYNVSVNSQGHSGSTFVPAGTYRLSINAIGNWTISIR